MGNSTENINLIQGNSTENINLIQRNSTDNINLIQGNIVLKYKSDSGEYSTKI